LYYRHDHAVKITQESTTSGALLGEGLQDCVQFTRRKPADVAKQSSFSGDEYLLNF